MAQSLSNLPIGSKVKFGQYSVNGETPQNIIWLIVAKDHTAYPSNSVTLLTEKIIDIRSFDANEPTNPDSGRSMMGNNDYKTSNIAQWLNSAETDWYSPAHAYDQAPNDSYTLGGVGYANRPGFLSHFSENEQNAILSTELYATKYPNTIESVFTNKVFLPSYMEVGVNGVSALTDGVLWSYFTSKDHLNTTVTEQCLNYSKATQKPNNLTTKWGYWLRSAKPDTSNNVYSVFTSADVSSAVAKYGANGIRPALNLSSTLSISDTTDSDGCYTIIWNSAPPKPFVWAENKDGASVIARGEYATVKWNAVTDPDGDAVSYELKMGINSEDMTTIALTPNTSYSVLIPHNAEKVSFSLSAIDSKGTAGVNEVVGYHVYTRPSISTATTNLGVKSSGFTVEYDVGDSDSETLTITEELDGVVIRSFSCPGGLSTQMISIISNTWLALTNGQHTISITANDGLLTNTMELTFTKSVSSLSYTSLPMQSSKMPTRIKVNVDREIPTTAIFKVEVCNNGNDITPTWEDMTSFVKSGLAYVFTNTTTTSSVWAVRIRVTVDRNGSSGACYISGIGGNFE